MDLPEEIKSIIDHVRKLFDEEASNIYKMEKYAPLLEKAKEEKDKYLDIRNIPKAKNTDVGGLTVKDGKTIFNFGLIDQGDYRFAEDKPTLKLLNELFAELVKRMKDKLKREYEIDVHRSDVTKGTHTAWITINFSEHLSKSILHYINSKNKPMQESVQDNEDHYDPDMSEKDAKRTLRTLSADIIKKARADKSYQVTQYTANIYANIITKNLLHKWAKGYNKFVIRLDSYQSFFNVEFKIPKLDQSFITRFIEGKETLTGFLHRSPIIKVKMSPRILHVMKNPEEPYQFFKALIQYYDHQIMKASNKLTVEMMRLPRNIKHLIATTNLYTIVSVPMSLLFTFDDIQMNKKNLFKLNESDVKAVNQFIKNITSRYASPEKEKKAIIDDMKKMVKSFNESGILRDHRSMHFDMESSVQEYLENKYDSYIKESEDQFIRENIDNEEVPTQIKLLLESSGMKKLKKIPKDLIPYIQIEIQAIKTYNDKHLIMGYCVSKLEIVDWYISLLDVGSKKYIVPHTKQYLIMLKTELLKCYKAIINKRIDDPNNYRHPVPWTDKYDG